MLFCLRMWTAALCSLLVLSAAAPAQQATVSLPLVSTSDSFVESFGTQFGYRGRNWFFNTGGLNAAAPPFGGFDPNAGARGGFGVRGSGGDFFFRFAFQQGSNRTITSTTQSATIQNGQIGAVRDISQVPFVTSIIPVVNSSVLLERLARLRAEAEAQQPGSGRSDRELLLGNAKSQSAAASVKSPAAPVFSSSTAERGDISLAEIRAAQESAPKTDPAAEVERLIEQARLAEASGRFGAARTRYSRAAARSSGELKRLLLKKVESLKSK